MALPLLRDQALEGLHFKPFTETSIPYFFYSKITKGLIQVGISLKGRRHMALYALCVCSVCVCVWEALQLCCWPKPKNRKEWIPRQNSKEHTKSLKSELGKSETGNRKVKSLKKGRRKRTTKKSKGGGKVKRQKWKSWRGNKKEEGGKGKVKKEKGRGGDGKEEQRR